MTDPTKDILLPYAFSLRAMPFRARRWRTAVVVESGRFTVHSTDVVDAPAVVQWTSSAGPSLGADIVSRHHDGRLYRPVMDAAGVAMTATSFERSLLECRSRQQAYRNWVFVTENVGPDPLGKALLAPLSWNGRTGALAAIQGERLQPNRRVEDDEVSRFAAAAAAYRTQLLIADGDVWTAFQAEPSWRVAHSWADGTVAVALKSSPVACNEVPFRADRLDAALRAAAELADTTSSRIVLADDRIDVFEPDLLRDDVVLLCEGMLEPWRLLGLRTTFSARKLLEGCPDDVRQLVAALLAQSGRDVIDVGTALRVFEQAADLVELLALQEPCRPLLENASKGMLPALTYFQRSTRSERSEMVPSDEDVDMILNSIAP